MTRPTPIDAAREFEINEMFFSTTDRAGRIRSGNHVFSRVSGYPLSELIGQPHNIIRHPDMPRTVFRIVWEYLLAGRPVAGLVKNLAKDGRHYWVLAFLTPMPGGFLSIRFKPSSALHPALAALYADMLAAEQAQEAAGADRTAAMRAGEERLQLALRGRGCDGYDDFMRALLRDEMKSRDTEIAARGLSLFPAELDCAGAASPETAILRAIYTEGRRAYDQVNRLYAQLDEFTRLDENIAAKSASVLQRTGDFRFIAFNAALRCTRLGEEARGLGVIADYLETASSLTSRLVRGLTERIQAVSARLRSVVFSLAAARLQIEMVMGFCAELATALKTASTDAAAAESRRMMIRELELSFATTVRAAIDALAEFDRELHQLNTNTEDLRRNLLTLQVAQVGGTVEASRLIGDDSFAVMFTDLQERVDGTKKELSELDDIASRLTVLASRTPEIAGVISNVIERMTREVNELSGAGGEAATEHAGVAGGAGTPGHD